MVKKNYDNLLSRFHLIPKRLIRTDGQTDGSDGQTDRSAISISRVSVLTRDKNRIRTDFRFSAHPYPLYLHEEPVWQI